MIITKVSPMKNAIFLSKIKRIRIFSFSLVFCLALVGMFLAAPVFAQTYTRIIIRPPHPGVFASLGYQQFKAYGETPSRQLVDISDNVDWYLTEYPFSAQTLNPYEVADIDENGLLTVNPGVTWGRVSVKACYPKGCGQGLTSYGGSSMTSTLSILLVPKFTVTALVNGANGAIDPVGDTIVKKGNTASFSFIPDTGYEVSSITGTCPAGSFTVGDTSYTTGPITADCTVEANFALSPVVTSSVDPTDSNGTIDPLGDTSVVTGQAQTFTLNAAAGFEASSITGTCPAGSFTVGDTSYTTGPISADCTVIAHFTQSPVVTSSVDPTDSNGSIDPLGATPVVTGQAQTFTLTPAVGFEASSISGDCPAGSFTVGDTSYTTGPISTDCTVVAHFTQSPIVTSSVDVTDSNGTIDPLGEISVITGQTQTFTLTPAAGFEASSVTGDCPAGSFDNPDHTSYTTGLISGDCTVVAHFTQSPLVTSSVDPTDSNGSIDPLGDTPVVTGQTQTFTLNPAGGYEASDITGTCPAGSFTVGDTSYTTGAIVADCTVIAHFTQSPVVTSSVDPTDFNGVISPSGANPVVTGQTATFTLGPVSGYEASSITGTCPTGSFSVGDTSYTTGPIAADCTVVAHFTATVAQKYTLQLVAISDGGQGRVYSDPIGPDCDTTDAVYGSCPSSADFNSGTTVTLMHQEDLGSFTVGVWNGWTGDADCNDGSVTMDANKICYGHFTPQI